MTQDEIIELARQAGLVPVLENVRLGDKGVLATDCIKTFAKLVEDAAFKRWAAQTKLAVQDEREACAMLCLWHNNTLTQNPTLFHMAELIRTRNNQ